MKYIRTKDGIYSRSKIICCAFAREYQSEDWNKDIEAYLQTKIVAEADTIEKLCDEFVMVGSDGENAQEKSLIELELNWKDYILESNESYEIYGAIWTPKGLIYVAKMNERGELELL